MAKGIAHREWQILREHYRDDQSFREAVQAELAMCENIGERLGVAIVAAPMRAKDIDWYTAGWVFKTATVPSGREPDPVSEIEALEEALAEPEPAGAE
jgi:hypothetical protein